MFYYFISPLCYRYLSSNNIQSLSSELFSSLKLLRKLYV